MREPTWEEFRQAVINRVKEMLHDNKWFGGVCLDGIEEFFPNDLEEAITHAYCETLYWDAPNHGFEVGNDYRTS